MKTIQFQKGEYPIKQVIFVNMDSVLGSLLTGPLFKEKYGKIDIIHDLRKEADENDLKVLMRTTAPVVSTCWSVDRTKQVLSAYLIERGWQDGDVRIYVLGYRAL